MKVPPLVRAMLWMAAASMCVLAQDLSVVVVDYAGVPRMEMEGAIRTATWAYRAAGIETDWIVCTVSNDNSETCNKLPRVDGKYLELDVMPRRAKTLDAQIERGEPAGLALVGADFVRPRAYAFYAATQNAAQLAVRPLDVVLGCVLVHESAHLLGLRHQSQGLMRDAIDAHGLDAAISGHPFSLGEVRRLRAEVVKFQSRGLSAKR